VNFDLMIETNLKCAVTLINLSLIFQFD